MLPTPSITLFYFDSFRAGDFLLCGTGGELDAFSTSLYIQWTMYCLEFPFFLAYKYYFIIIFSFLLFPGVGCQWKYYTPEPLNIMWND